MIAGRYFLKEIAIYFKLEPPISGVIGIIYPNIAIGKIGFGSIRLPLEVFIFEFITGRPINGVLAETVK